MVIVCTPSISVSFQQVLIGMHLRKLLIMLEIYYTNTVGHLILRLPVWVEQISAMTSEVSGSPPSEDGDVFNLFNVECPATL